MTALQAKVFFKGKRHIPAKSHVKQGGAQRKVKVRALRITEERGSAAVITRL